MPRPKTHGVFRWRPDGRYVVAEAKALYCSERAAQRRADKMNNPRTMKKEDGYGYVERALKHLPGERAS